MDALIRIPPTDRRSPPERTQGDRWVTARTWADAYLRAHGVVDYARRSRILTEVLARTAARGGDEPAAGDLVPVLVEETQRYLDTRWRRLASLSSAPDRADPTAVGRLAFARCDGARRFPDALVGGAPRLPAELRFALRTLRLPTAPTLTRSSMASRPDTRPRRSASAARLRALARLIAPAVAFLAVLSIVV